jgi:MFS transporter, DHA1 family, multidrug resistance protein
LAHGSVVWVVSIFLIGYVIGQLIYAPLANRFGRLKALRLGLLINFVGICICLFAVSGGSFSLLLVGRLVTALGAAAGLSCSFMLINELLDRPQAKRAMSFAMVYFTIGIAISVTLSGLITQFFHWQYCFWILLIQGAVMFASTWLFPETLKIRQKIDLRTIFHNYRLALNSTTLIKYSVIVGLNSGFTYCYATAAPIYTQSILHLTSSQYGCWNLINIVGMLMSGIVSAKLLKSLCPKKIILFSLLFMMPGVISLIITIYSKHPEVLVFFATTMYLFFFGGLLFPSGSYLASNSITDKTSASSMMSFLYMGSALLSVIAMGYMPGSALWSFALVIAVFLIISIILSGGVFRLSILKGRQPKLL